MQTFRLHTLSLTVLSTLLLTACGGSDGGSNTATTQTPVPQGVKSLKTGMLLEQPTTFKTLTAEQIKQASEAIEPNSANVIGTPKCGVSVQYMHYDTLDAKGQPTNATGAVFVPTGDDPSCQGSVLWCCTLMVQRFSRILTLPRWVIKTMKQVCEPHQWRIFLQGKVLS